MDLEALGEACPLHYRFLDLFRSLVITSLGIQLSFRGSRPQLVNNQIGGGALDLEPLGEEGHDLEFASLSPSRLRLGTSRLFLL